MAARSYIRGPRFAVAPEKMRACEKCVYGTGEHADFCDQAKPEKRDECT